MKKLGRLPRKFDCRIPHLSSFLSVSPQLPPPPISIDYSEKLPDDLGEFQNDTLGDCTCAAFYHAIQVWSFNATGIMVTEPDEYVLSLYEKACGYDPGNPDSDQGGCEQDVLTYLMNNGAPTESGVDKISAFMEVDFRNLDDLKRTIADCGVAYIGVNLPQSVIDNADDNTVPWDTGGDTSIAGGHAVILVGYDLDSFTCISWGKRYKLTVGFMGQYLEEAYAIADSDWINSKGITPFGMTLSQLEQTMVSLKE